MKNKLNIIAAIAATVVATTAQAIPITGNIGFAGNVTLDTLSAGTATTIINYFGATTPDVIVQSDTPGSILATLISPGTQVAFSAPWNFMAAPSTINPFWSDTIPGTTLEFVLTSWSAVYGSYQGNANVTIAGLGLLENSGYDNTPYTYSLTLQDPASGGPDQFTFSASQAAVPDGGATAMLLGVALTGVGVLRKKLTA